MAELQALAHFPGVKQIENYSGTLSHGASPSVHRLDIAPQFGFPKIQGPLTLTFGKVRVTLDDCKIDTASYERSSEGAIVSLAILDRRWKWAFPTITGAYNVRGDDGEILKDNPGGKDVLDDCERTPQQLAELLLDAMGEVGYDIADLPNKTRPTVYWDRSNAARALAELCDQLGCRLVLEITGKVAIRKSGLGKGGKPSAMPPGPLTPNSSEEIELPERPDEIEIVTAPILFQQDFLLEAVGLETSGAVAGIDSLTYKPAGGWSVLDIPTFASVAEPHRELASETVFRWYRIKTPLGTPYLPGKRIDKLTRFLPLRDKQVETVLQDGKRVVKDAQVFGIWFGEFDPDLGNTATTLRPLTAATTGDVIRDWSLDQEFGIVKFSRPVYANRNADSPLEIVPAVLVLRTSFNLINSETRTPLRYSRARKLGGPKAGTKARVEIKDDVQPTSYVVYAAGGYFPPLAGNQLGPRDATKFTVSKLVSNIQTEINKQCDYYLDAIEAEYKNNDPQQATYAGIMPINPDGALQAISWTIGKGGAFTTVSRNRDFGTETTVAFAERRRLEKQEAINKAVQEAQIAKARNQGRPKA